MNARVKAGRGRARKRDLFAKLSEYPYRVVYVRFIGTHAQYDRIDAQTI